MTNTRTTALPIRDAITGESVAVIPAGDCHPALGRGRHVILDTGTGGADLWLTPTAAVALAETLRQAAAAVLAAVDNEDNPR